MRSGVIAAALMTTNGPSARLDALCSVRAASSLPEPDGTDDQDAAVGLGGPLDGLAQLIHAGGAPGQDARRRRELLELLHFALQTRRLQRPRRHQDQPVGLERLFDEVVGAALDRGDRGLDIAVPGDHHHRQLGMVPLDLLQQLQAVELAALQPDVEKHQMRAAIGDFRQRRIAVARGPGGKTLVVENARNQIANIRFVIDNQNVICHGLRLSCQLPVAASIFVSMLVASAGSVGFGCRWFCFAACCFASAFGAWPEMAKRSRIQAPRCARPDVGGIVEFDPAAMVFQHPADDRQPEAGALFARRHIGLEQTRPAHLRQADRRCRSRRSRCRRSRARR